MAEAVIHSVTASLGDVRSGLNICEGPSKADTTLGFRFLHECRSLTFTGPTTRVVEPGRMVRENGVTQVPKIHLADPEAF